MSPEAKVNYTYPNREGFVNCTEVKNELTTTDPTATTVRAVSFKQLVSVVAKPKFKIEVAMAFNCKFTVSTLA
jgi:hypothetical protein